MKKESLYELLTSKSFTFVCILWRKEWPIISIGFSFTAILFGITDTVATQYGKQELELKKFFTAMSLIVIDVTFILSLITMTVIIFGIWITIGIFGLILFIGTIYEWNRQYSSPGFEG